MSNLFEAQEDAPTTVVAAAEKPMAIPEDISEIDKLIAELQAKREFLNGKQRADALKTIIEMMTKSKISLADVQQHLKSGKVSVTVTATPTEKEKTKVPVKYIGPNAEQWTGRGRNPRWVTQLEAEGKSLKDYLIGKTVAVEG